MWKEGGYFHTHAGAEFHANQIRKWNKKEQTYLNIEVKMETALTTKQLEKLIDPEGDNGPTLAAAYNLAIDHVLDQLEYDSPGSRFETIEALKITK
jgi:hypothetical protein